MNPKGRGHGRLGSIEERRVNRPRSNTRGPLDEGEDPLSAAVATADSPSSTPSRALSPDSTSHRPSSSAAQRYAPQYQNPNLAALRSPRPASSSPTRSNHSSRIHSPTRPELDLTPLLSPAHYLPLPPPPHPFQSRTHTRATTTPIPALLTEGAFHSAAIAAAEQLTRNTSPDDLPRIFALLYVRLASLVLLGHVEEASREAAATVGDWTQPVWLSYGAGRHPANLVPFGLRVLLTKLQAEATGPAGHGADPRRAIMGLYELAREARANIVRISGALKEGGSKLETGEVEKLKEERKMWRGRLRDLGVTVAGILVDVGDLEAASEHLEDLNRSFSVEEQGDVSAAFIKHSRVTEALVWLRLGDLPSAKRIIESLQGEDRPESDAKNTYASAAELLPPLLKVAEGDYAAAVEAWEALHEQYPGDLAVQNNLAVCLLYTRRLNDAREHLLSMLNNKEGKPRPFPSLIFNMATLFELTSEKARDRKMDVAGMLAGLDPDSECGGWERSAMELKL